MKAFIVRARSRESINRVAKMKEPGKFLTRIFLVLVLCLGQSRLQHQDDELGENDIVKVNAGIQVPFGRSVFLDPVNELNIEVRPGHRCTVRVIQNDPLTQRPGQLTPPHFPCQFGPDEVRYSHYGARTPQQDKVKLLVRYDTEEDTVILPLSIHVQVAFEQLEIVNKNTPLLVNRLMGVSATLDESILQFNFDRTTQNCEIAIVPKMDGPPSYGHVVNDTEPGIMRECGQFLRSDIRYRHTFQDSPNKDYIPMVVELTDREGTLIKQEYFQVMVLIQEGQENSQPQPSFHSLLLMDVNQFVMTAITPNILAAEDAETPEDRLIFNITIPLGYGEGQIVSTDDVTVPISSFYQKDIEDLKIAFIPPSSDSKTQRIFQIEMEVIDSDGKASDPFSLMIVVKPMNTLAPLATKNTGLMLVEGQSRKLQSSKNLQIADEDNIEDVTISVLDGLRHGKLLMLGVPVKHFSPADLDVGVIIYQHDGTDTYTDNIIFRLDDGQHKVEFLFPVSVYPSDDEPPILNVNMGLNVRKGEDSELSSFVLSATDIDSDDSTIKFELVPPLPLDSQILMKKSDKPDDIGNWTLSDGVYERVVTSWTQDDLSEGHLYYRYIGHHNTEPIIKKLKFKVSDDQSPPNESTEQELVIKIESQDDIEPKLFPGTPLEVSVEEFQVTKLTKKQIRYTDLDTKDRFLTLRITRRPYDTDLNNPMNPGTLVYSDRIDRQVDEFTQAEINHHKIAYRPPPVEMGIVPRIIQFDFEVIDSNNNVLRDQVFRILLKPVNNKPPVILNTGFHIYENGRFNITPDVLDASDADTVHDFIIFSVADPPQHGALELRGRKLESGDTFTRNDIQNGEVTYVNGGDEKNQDILHLEVSDGIHRVPIPVNIHVSLVDDEAPTLHLNAGSYGIQLATDEGGRVQINSKLLRASDPDSNDLMITYKISSNPKHGVIEVDGELPAAQFKQKEIEEGKVYYIHNGDEIGKDAANDTFNLTVSDASQNWVVDGNRIDQVRVTVEIIPKDNVPPVVMVTNPIRVEEAGKVFLTSHDISAADIDTDDSEIVCVIEIQPTHGYLENISPLPGSEKSRAGLPITAFTISDVQNGYIAYIQGSHSGVEPVEDRLTFSCSDGVNFSPKFNLEIEIEPKNDEQPQIHLREFIVMEGMDLQIDLPILNAIDLDVPAQNLTFTVVRKPKHGTIVTQLSTGTFEINDFTLDDIAATSSNVVYHHDDSETTKDDFELEITDGLYHTRKTVIVMIIPMDDETPRLTINNGLEVSAGEVRTITNQDLKAEDVDSVDSNLTFVVRQSPRHGYLVYVDEETGTELYNLTTGFNFSQYNIDNEKVKYVHTGSEGVRDLIKFDITDGTNTLIDRYFWIQVEGIDISYPHVINHGVELPEGGKITLTTDILSTSDINSNDEHLRFTITRPPAKGHLESTNKPGMFISTFTQLDLAGNKIYYVHTSHDELKMDSFEFEVTDGYNSVYRTFRISISDVDNKKPVLYVSPMRVREGGRKLITPFELKVEDMDTPEESLKIIIVEKPLHGQIINIELGVVNSFTMSDLIENKISYQHDGSESYSDEFKFILTDGTHVDFFVHPNLNDATTLPQKLTVEVYAVDNKPPHLIANKGLSSLTTVLDGQLGFRLDRKVLCVKDRDSEDSNLLYIITTQPKHGIMFNSKNKQRISNFTQGNDDFTILKGQVSPKICL